MRFNFVDSTGSDYRLCDSFFIKKWVSRGLVFSIMKVEKWLPIHFFVPCLRSKIRVDTI